MRKGIVIAANPCVISYGLVQPRDVRRRAKPEQAAFKSVVCVLIYRYVVGRSEWFLRARVADDPVSRRQLSVAADWQSVSITY